METINFIKTIEISKFAIKNTPHRKRIFFKNVVKSRFMSVVIKKIYIKLLKNI